MPTVSATSVTPMVTHRPLDDEVEGGGKILYEFHG